MSVANRRINRLAKGNAEYLGMGTTVVCALLAGGQLVVAHVGDSRLYLCSDRTLVQLTEDDSWETAIAGRSNSSAPRGARHVLTSVLGARPDTEVHVLERDLSGDETLLLCSDGLHGVVPPDTLRDVLASDQDLQAVAQSLIAAALNHGSRDNITALVVRSAGK